MRRPPGPRVRGWPATDRPAVLHQFGRAGFPGHRPQAQHGRVRAAVGSLSRFPRLRSGAEALPSPWETRSESHSRQGIRPDPLPRAHLSSALCTSMISVETVRPDRTEHPVTLTPAAQKFVLHWGEMGQAWGINRTMAQVHALLFVAPTPLDAEEISKLLDVSRSNVSTS